MGQTNRHGYPTIKAFVEARIASFQNTEHTFQALFQLMFTEAQTLFYEKTEGYRIVQITYGQAKDETLRRAAALKARLSHLPQDAVVGLHVENTLSFIELFWSVLLCGWRPLLLNLRLDQAVLAQALADSGAAAVISDGPQFTVETVPESQLSPAQLPLPVGETGSELFIMSSGSSGHVKLCAYGAEEFYWQIHASCDILKSCSQIKKHYNGHLKQLGFLPLYHIFGLVTVYIWFSFFSCCLVQLDDLSPQTIVNTVRRHGVTHIFAVPLFWEKVYQEAMRKIAARGEKTLAKFHRGMAVARRIGGVPLLGRLFCRLAFREVRREMFGDSVKFMITGGSCISPEILTFFNAIGYYLCNGYGMSEIGITSVELSSRQRLRCSGVVGKPLPSAEYRLASDGELQIRSQAAARYTLEDGVRHPRQEWFATRDLAQCENGRYRILGRMDDLIVSPSGENLNPTLIEPLLTIPGLAQPCLTAVPGPSGKTPALLVSLRRRVSPKELEELSKTLRDLISQAKLDGEIGKLVFIADDLLAPQEFKLNRRALTQRYVNGQLTVLTPQTCEEVYARDDSALAVQLRAMFAVALNLPEEEITDNTDFFLAGGGSSLDYLALVSQIQTEYGVSLPTDGSNSPRTVREFCQRIKAGAERGS